MSTVNPVPETADLVDEGPHDVVAAYGTWRMLRDAASRFRWSDGFSHARATALQISLTLLPASIALVAIGSLARWDSVSALVTKALEAIAPGTVSREFEAAVRQGVENGDANHIAAIVAGVIATLIAGTTTFGQIERGANRIYGIESDRPTMQKYRAAALMMVFAGSTAAGFLAAVGLGQAWRAGGSHSSDPGFGTVHWLLGAACLFIATGVVLRWSPRRRQPGWAWLWAGIGSAAGGIVLVTLLLRAYLSANESFGDTYGPFAGLIGILLWSYGVSIVLFMGIALAAQMEAVRAGAPEVRSPEKIAVSEPDLVPLPYGAALRTAQEEMDEQAN